MAVIRSTSRSVLAGLVVVAGVALAGCAAGQVSQTAVQSPTIDGISAQVGTMSIRNLALEYPDQGSYEKGSDARLRMVIVNDSSSSDTLTAVRSNVSTDVTISAGASGAALTPTLTAPPPSDQPTGTASGTPTGTKEPADSSVTGTATTGPSESPSGSASGSASESASESASGSASASASGSGSAGATPSEGPPAQIRIPANGLVSFTGDGPTVLLKDLTQKLYPGQTLQVTLVFQKAGQVTATIAVSAPRGQISLAPTVTGAPDGNEG
ncbi:MAG TPA: copper chaperone PCu(A)C [Mycobacteriales bacterium]